MESTNNIVASRFFARNPVQTTDGNYADDIALLANTLTQATLERAAGRIGLYVNADKTEYTCFYQSGNISTLKGGPFKLVDKFTYLGSSVSSTENDISTWLSIDYRSYGSQT